MQNFKVSSVLDCPVDIVKRYATKPKLFVFVSQPFCDVVPVEPGQFPEQWDEGTYRIKLKLLSKLPFGEQTLILSYPNAGSDVEQFIMVDNGFGDAVSYWHHRMTLTAMGSNTHYTDEIEFDAGWLTPAVAQFVKRLYRHRHKRWAELVKANFRQLI